MKRVDVLHLERLKFFWLGMAAGAFYWMLESSLHSFIFEPNHGFMQALAGGYDANEIIMRLVIVLLLLLLGLGADIHNHRQLYLMKHAEDINRLLRLLSHVNRVVQRHTVKQELFDSACKAAVEIGGFRLAWIGMKEGDTLKLAAWAVDDPALDGTIRQMEDSPCLGVCLGARDVLKTGEPVLCELREKADCDAPWKAGALVSGCEHAACMPLRIGEETIGVFEVYAGGDGRLGEDEKAIQAEVADDVSAALTNIEHERQRRADEEQLKGRLDELERFQKATVDREFRIKELREEIAALKARTEGNG